MDGAGKSIHNYFMVMSANVIGQSAARHMVLRVVLVLFVLRALLPIGFMPDISALHDGQVEFVVCSAAGNGIPVAMGSSAYPGSNRHQPKSAGYLDCPFATVVSKSLALPTVAPPLPVPDQIGDKGPTRAERIDIFRDPGPPFFSHAPPHSLG
jgi:hypothetical protein